MKDLEIFYFDVDGTLLNNETNEVPPSTIKALHALKQMGYKLAVCTGRNRSAINYIKEIIDWDGFVLSNGCAVYDHNLNLIYDKPFETNFVNRLIQASEAPLFLEGNDMFFSKKPHGKLKEALEHFNVDFTIEILNDKDYKIYNIMSYDFDDLDFNLLPDFHAQTDTFRDVLGNTEIVPKDTGKHRGCHILNQVLNVSRFCGFGDGENDIEFLKSATISVAMGNAKAHVKEHADYITTSIHEDGILNGLKMLGIL